MIPTPKLQTNLRHRHGTESRTTNTKMNEQETALAAKILEEATNADSTPRSYLLDQYDRLIRAASTRVEMERHHHYTATTVNAALASEGGL